MFVLLLLSSLLILNLAISALLLRLGAGWLKAPGATFGRAVVVVLGIGLGSLAAMAMIHWVSGAVAPGSPVHVLFLALGSLLLFSFWCCLLIKALMRTSWLGSGAVWLLSLMPALLGNPIVYLVIRPFVMEAYILPTNAMAPTLLGWHKTASCPHCGQTMTVPALPPQDAKLHFPQEENLGICGTCWKASEPKDVSEAVGSPDKVICNKLLTPRRWDLLVFRFPRDPSAKYVFRLIGMPGEKVFLKDGAIWVNGAKVQPPDSIFKVEYSTLLQGGIPTFMGSEDQPWQLGDDEYCVLGDFGLHSSDSRSWGPVPAANVEGVVSLRYWPLSRWEVWR